MGKLEDLAKISFTNGYLRIIENCKLKKQESIKGELKKGEYEIGDIIDCNGLDIDIAFQELLAANKVFNIAKKMGL